MYHQFNQVSTLKINIMKKLLLSCLSGTLFATNLIAADLCVNESGSGGCYSSITAALAAASDGDRILIQPKTGGVPYVENLSINKSIQLLSNQEGVMWDLTGNITITPAVGRTISILHMKNTTGNITSTGNSPVGARCKVNIMNCELMQGYINFDFDYFEVNLVSSIVSNGYVVIKYGNIIGNSIKSNSSSTFNVSGNHTGVLIKTDALHSNDTLYIIGNLIENTNTVNYTTGINWNNSSQFFHISNNYINNSGYYLHRAIGITAGKNSSIALNKVHNNTCYSNSGTAVYIGGTSYGFQGISISTSAVPNFQVEFLNNIILCPNANYHSLADNTGTNGGIISFSYNYASPNSTLYGVTNNGTNNLTSNSSINITNGQLNSGSDAINGGYPDLTYYDLDLTVNDVGAYGGSFSLDNFHPITGAARVYFVNAPRTILQSGTLNIKANAFDR